MSTQPRLPQRHSGPFSSTVLWPSSPAMPTAPRRTVPPDMSPEPIPVAMWTYAASLSPRAAPLHDRAAARRHCDRVLVRDGRRARAVARRIVAGQPRCRSAGASRLPVSLVSGAAHTALILHAVANDGEMLRQTETRRSRHGGPNSLQIWLD